MDRGSFAHHRHCHHSGLAHHRCSLWELDRRVEKLWGLLLEETGRRCSLWALNNNHHREKL